MFGYDYFNVGPNFDLNAVDPGNGGGGGGGSSNSKQIRYHNTYWYYVLPVKSVYAWTVYDNVGDAGNTPPLASGTESSDAWADSSAKTAIDELKAEAKAAIAADCTSRNRDIGQGRFWRGCGGCLDGYREAPNGNCYEYYVTLPPDEDEEVEIQGETNIYSPEFTRNLLVATVGILGLLVLWKK